MTVMVKSVSWSPERRGPLSMSRSGVSSCAGEGMHRWSKIKKRREHECNLGLGTHQIKPPSERVRQMLLLPDKFNGRRQHYGP
jgi:hypothetical protein